MNARTKGRVQRLGTALAVLFLVLALLSLMAYMQRPTPAGASDPSPVTPAAGTDAAATSPNCTTPPTGQKARLFAEDEIVVAYRAKKNDKSLENAILDNSGKNLVWGGNQFFSNFDQLADVRWPAITTADLNGDGKRELVSAFRDKQKRIAVITNSAGSTPWYRDGRGENAEWVDVAAGNLDRSTNGDDEVVVAYADNYQDIHLDVLDGNSQGNIAQLPNQTKASYYDYNAGRQDVEYVAVATGDLNGDGYNDEIVTVFRDGNQNLQCLILRYDPASPGLTLVWSRAWRNHDRAHVAWEDSGFGNERPIDVTTGDVDGDKQDEVILAFRGGMGAEERVQLFVLDYQGLDSQGLATFDDRVFLERDADSTLYYAAPTCVSVSAADLDRDGQDEIALAYNAVGGEVGFTTHWQQHLLTYEFVPPQAIGWPGCTDDQGKPLACLQERPGHWRSAARNIPAFVSEVNPAAHVVMDTGDLDLDGKAEIALIRQDHDTGDAQVYSFDADTGLSERSSYAITQQGKDRVEEFWLAMGDINGDSWYGTYTGNCYEKKEAQVTAVVHAPPHWEENGEEAEAGFGQSVGNGAGSGKTAESKIGGSVKVGVQVHEIGPSFTYEWEKSCAVEHTVVTSTVEGVKFVTHPPYLYPEEPYFGAIEFVETKSWCYEYTEPHLGTMTVCLPRPPGETTIYNYPLDWWYTEGITEYPDSWVPVGINLAQGRPATQSSTWETAEAARAVDGNTDGNYYNGSVAHTGYDMYPWWQVDLGRVQWLDAVSVWNRTDAFQSRLSDFYVFVSDVPFPSNDPGTLYTDPNVWHDYVSGQGGRPTSVAVNHQGRYVRVQLPRTNYLHMAEVQVWGMPGAVDQWPTARPVTTTVANTFQIAWPGGLQQTVNGQLLYTWNGSQLGIAPSSGAAEFDLGLGKEGETVNEGSTETSASLGMEIKTTEVEATMGTTQKTSYILSWSNDVEFSGVAGGLPRGTSVNLKYSYAPYVWVQRAVASGGTRQAFMVLDYWVPSIGPTAAGTAPATMPETTPSTTLRAGLLVTPTVPLIGSPTHPDPATWYVTSTATFTWTQPAGDPATVDGYRWYLDQVPGTIPARLNLGLATTHTYQGLRDGVWYLHVRARSDGGEWSGAAHRAIRVDVNPPQVRLAVDPPWPTGHNGWYVTPLTVTVAATDSTGSGVAAVEASTDGVTWQPYAAPLSFTADTASTTVWARATDFVGHTSVPVSTTFRIDQTPPSSHVSGGQGPGAWVATVITNSLGNSQLTLAGAISDTLSGRAGLNLGFDNLDWTSASPIGVWHPIPDHPEIEVNWYFTATTELGRGDHVFYGRAQDEAGNLEAPYELAQVVWFPEDSPDLDGSSLTALPGTVRPGEAVTFTLAARNGGWQEALVAVTDTLPAGLTLITDTLAEDVGYDLATGVITWPARLLWPGQWVWHTFQTRVDAGLGATSLENRATAHAFWPNTESLPADQRQRFLDHEQAVVVTATVAVDPNLPAGTDVVAPWAGLTVLGGQAVTGTEATLGILAAPDARWMYLREWTADPTTGAWTVAQDSGWLRYSPTYSGTLLVGQMYTWTLSAGEGVKYLGVWVADGARNVSVLNEGSLAFVNRIGSNQVLLNGQRMQYRGNVERGTWAVAYLTTVSGDPDLYIWRPFNGFLPDLYSNDTVGPGHVESTGEHLVQRSGRFLMEVQAVGDSEYQVALAAERPDVAAARHALGEKERPAHPLTISDPLSAGRAGAPTSLPHYELYLPIVIKNR